jgi:hypothetical protein
METEERIRSAGRRLTEPIDSVAQHVARRANESVVEALDFNTLLDQIDLNRVLDQVDVNRLLDKVDVDRLLDQVDVAKLVARIDMQALLDRVDINDLVARVDIDAVMRRTKIEEIVARSTSTIADEGVDLVRSQAVGLDDFFARLVNRLRHRGYSGPRALPGTRAEP